MISKAPPTHFSLTFSESIGAASTSESTRHLWNRFRSRFWRRQWLNFHWQFLSQHGLGVQKNPLVTFGTVSLTISKSPSTQFSLTFSKSTGAASTSESTRHLWKVFRWWFLSRQRTSFRWLFLSQQGQLVLTNPRVTFGISFVHDFGDGSGLVFINNF